MCVLRELSGLSPPRAIKAQERGELACPTPVASTHTNTRPHRTHKQQQPRHTQHTPAPTTHTHHIASHRIALDSFAVERGRRPVAGVLDTESPLPASLLRRAPAPLAAMSPSMFDMGLDNIDLWRSEEMQLVQVR